VARMSISLPNAHIRGKRKTMRRKRSLTKATRKIRNSQRRSPMVKLLLVRNRTQVMRVSSKKVMKNCLFKREKIVKNSISS
jgi:hypothetical protein